MAERMNTTTLSFQEFKRDGRGPTEKALSAAQAIIKIQIDMPHLNELQPNEIVTFEVGQPKLLRFSKGEMGNKKITDPDTGKFKQVPALFLDVTEEDGKLVDKELSVIQKRLAGQLTPHFESGELFKRPVRITKLGAGLAGAQWTVELLQAGV